MTALQPMMAGYMFSYSPSALQMCLLILFLVIATTTTTTKKFNFNLFRGFSSTLVCSSPLPRFTLRIIHTLTQPRVKDVKLRASWLGPAGPIKTAGGRHMVGGFLRDA